MSWLAGPRRKSASVKLIRNCRWVKKRKKIVTYGIRFRRCRLGIALCRHSAEQWRCKSYRSCTGTRRPGTVQVLQCTTLTHFQFRREIREWIIIAWSSTTFDLTLHCTLSSPFILVSHSRRHLNFGASPMHKHIKRVKHSSQSAFSFSNKHVFFCCCCCTAGVCMYIQINQGAEG